MSLLLIAYDSGVALYNFNTGEAQLNYDLIIPPGAMGGGTQRNPAVFEERRPNCVCIAWRPDGTLIFPPFPFLLYLLQA